MAASRPAHSVWQHVVLAALFWALVAAKGPSYPVAYCARLNTADMPANYSTWQSEGLCHDFCIDEYALAVVHENDCWCTDFVPSPKSQVSTDKCANSCPGFPDDVCGGNGLFGYIALGKRPSGTATSGTTSSTTRAPNPGKSDPPPTVSTVTADGTVRTVTVAPTAGSNSANLDSSPNQKLSTGAAVGVAVGVVAVVIAVAAGILFFFIKRRRQRRAEEQGDYDPPSQRGSSSGMMGTPKTEMSENRYVGGSDGRAMSENWESTTQGKRRSTLMPIDPRMDPSTQGIYHRPENKSHESIASLRDDQDYSRRVHEPPRVLRAMNPDPDIN